MVCVGGIGASVCDWCGLCDWCRWCGYVGIWLWVYVFTGLMICAYVGVQVLCESMCYVSGVGGMGCMCDDKYMFCVDGRGCIGV